MKTYEVTVVGRKLIRLNDEQNIDEYMEAVSDGRGQEIIPDGYDSPSELIDDMEFDGFDYKRVF